MTVGLSPGSICDEQARDNLQALMPARASHVKWFEERSASVAFELDAPYPAAEPLSRTRQVLESREWQELRASRLLKGEPVGDAAGWFDYVDGTINPKVRTYQWIGEWANRGGDILIVTYLYRGSDDTLFSPPVGRLHVAARVICSHHLPQKE
jgi:hypothetical protein